MQTADNKLTLYFFVLGQDLTAKELTFKATDADDNKYTSAEFDGVNISEVKFYDMSTKTMTFSDRKSVV